MDAIGYSSGLLAHLLLVRSWTLYRFQGDLDLVYYICILDSLSRCYIYICSVGPIEDCCVMLLLRFPPARKCLVGTFESFLCGFGEFCSNLHRSDSGGVTNSLSLMKLNSFNSFIIVKIPTPLCLFQPLKFAYAFSIL